MMGGNYCPPIRFESFGGMCIFSLLSSHSNQSKMTVIMTAAYQWGRKNDLSWIIHHHHIGGAIVNKNKKCLLQPDIDEQNPRTTYSHSICSFLITSIIGRARCDQGKHNSFSEVPPPGKMSSACASFEAPLARSVPHSQ